MNIELKNKEFWFHILFWFCVSLLPLGAFLFTNNTIPNSFVFRFFINPLVFYLNYFILVPHLLLKKRILQYLVVSIPVLFAINILISSILPETPFDNLSNLISDNELPPQINLIKFVIPAIISFFFFLLGGTIALIKNFYLKEEIRKQVQIKQKESELQFLKAQLNPHFLFNSLNSIYALVKQKRDTAGEAVLVLSDLMRYMLYEATAQRIYLSKELNFVKDYIALQKLRLVSSSEVVFNVNGNIKNQKIAPLLLITFVENAFKYGTDSKGKTVVTIDVILSETNLIFTVKNQLGLEKEKNNKNSGIGLTNIKNRLAYLYPNNHALELLKEDNFFKVNLKLDIS